MSWHFSRALEAEYSAATCSAGDASVPSNETPTHGTFWSPGRTTDASRRSRSGMTYARSTDAHGEALLTWFRGAFRARTSRSPEREQESTASDRDSGARWRELSARYDRDSSSWKTHRLLFDEALPWSSVILPRWGAMRDGVCWERLTPERRKYESDCGLWPTPNCGGYRSDGELRLLAKVCDSQAEYEAMAHRACRSKKDRWATPTAQDASNNASPSQYRRNSIPLNAQVGGKLNPTWVEWLMGWPLGWTDCAASATDRFRQWCDSHGKHSAKEFDE